MKKILALLFTGLLFVFTSCNDDDGYSLNDVWIGFGIVQSTDSYSILMDNGDVLIPVAFGNYEYQGEHRDSTHNRKIEKGDRVLVNYTVLDDKLDSDNEIEAYYVKINGIEEVLMKGIMEITSANQDSIGNDPIVVKEHWVTNNLLNVQIRYWGYNKIHYINLVKKPGKLTAASQPVELELRHNANDDKELIPYSGFVSFKLDTLQVPGLDSIQFKVKSIDYDGKTNEFTGVYKYGGNH